ncbi:MAG: DUF2490 domain-containing protein [Saprospiraceae bacterium]|nr:DUF2490 domain-containing protein [Saprospiraceae bacterium]
MKKFALMGCFTFCIFFASKMNAQIHMGVNIRIDGSKTWKLNKKTRLEVSQQFQVNPENAADPDQPGDIFNEISLFPSNNDDPNAPKGQFQDPLGAAYDVLLEWRSATSVQVNYRIKEWFRVGQSYRFNLRGNGETRHIFQTTANVTERVNKTFEFSQRIDFQYTSRVKKGNTIWEEDIVARTGFSWDFSKKYTYETTVGVNGAFDDGEWEWDRMRVDLGLRYRMTKKQSFDFGYRFQRTLDKKNGFRTL